MANTSSRCIIPLPSVNYAMTAAKLLSQRGISARQVKTDPTYGKPGCSNGIEVDCRELKRARDLLISNSIPVS